MRARLAVWLALGPLALGVLLAAGPAAAQEADTTSVPAADAALEDLDETAGAPLAEDLAAWRLNPFDLNTAPAADLARLPGLTPLLATRIVQTRAARRGFASLPELRTVEGMTDERYALVRPYLYLGPNLRLPTPPPGAAPGARRARRPPPPRWSFDATQRLTRDLPPLADTTDRYEGGPDRLLTRLRLRRGRTVNAGLTLDKDAGEAFGWRPDEGTYGFDYVSGAVAVDGVGRVVRAVAGDDALSVGQGLVLWRAGALGKSREATSGVARLGGGVTPHFSSEENRFFRGAAATVRAYGPLRLTAFGSRRGLDGADVDSLTVGSFGTSGLHRTPSERARKDVLDERLAGGAVEARGTAWGAGVVALASRYSPGVTPDSTPERRFAFRGARYGAVSAYANATRGPAYLFAEAARESSGALAATGGVLVDAGRQGEVVVAARSFGRDFAGLHGAPFGEQSRATNEQGLYVGARLVPRPRWTVRAYADGFRFPWLRFATPRPTSGLDLLASVEHRPRRWLSWYVLLRDDQGEDGVTVETDDGRAYRTIQPVRRSSARLHGEYVFSRQLTLRSRVEGVRSTEGAAPARFGTLLYADVRYVPKPDWTVEARLAQFDADSYGARLYAYEYDVRGSFSVPALSGTGTRAYLLVRALAFDRLTVEARFSATRYEPPAARRLDRDLHLQATLQF